MKLNLRGLPPDQGMNTERRMITRSVQDRKAGHNPVFKAVLIYENFATGVRARSFCERLVRALDKTLEEQMWSFDALGIREARNAAATRQAESCARSTLRLIDSTKHWLYPRLPEQHCPRGNQTSAL